MPVPIRNAQTILTFRGVLKSHLFDLTLPPLLRVGPAPCDEHAFNSGIAAPMSSVL